MHLKTIAVLLVSLCSVSLCSTLQAQTASQSGAAQDGHPWDPWLATVTGRVIDHAGESVAGMRVELLEADSSLLMRPEYTPLGRERLDVGATLTDPDGRFTFERAHPRAFHALILDGGGARASARFVEQTLAAGALTDAGDVVLAAGGTVVGTVVDEGGDPIAGARVRFGPVPAVVLQWGGLELRDDCVVALGVDTVFIVGVPPHAMALVERLPWPTAHTADDGSFRLTGVPLGAVTGGVDLPGFVAAIVPSFELTESTHDLGAIRLDVGRTLQGRVVDSLGEPVANAEVRAGALGPTSEIGILQPTGLTDGDGRFEITGVREVGRVVACARRATGRAWWRGRAEEGAAEVEVAVPPTAPLTVRVNDDMGEPLPGARVTLRQWPPLMDVATMAINLALSARGARPSFRSEEIEPGVHVVYDVPLGYCFIQVESPGRAPTEMEVEHATGPAVHEMVCAPGRRLTINVTDAVSGAPIEGACARAVRPLEVMWDGLGMGFSDERGSVTIGQIPGPGDEFWERGFDAVLLVEHPLYAAIAMPLPDDSDVVDAHLRLTSTLTGRVTWGVGPPGAASMLMLDRDTEFVDVLEPEYDTEVARPPRAPQFARTNSEGGFRFTELEDGMYTLVVYESLFDRDALWSVLGGGAPEPIHTLSVYVGGESEGLFEISLDARGEGPMELRLIVEVVAAGSGVPIEEADVFIGDAFAGTDANGRAELLLDRAGMRFVSVRAGGHADANVRRRCDVLAPVPQLRIELADEVACAGRVVLPEGLADAEIGGLELELVGEDGAQHWAGLDIASPTFTLSGVGAGNYVGTLLVDGVKRKGVAVDVKLGPKGDANLVLVLK